MTPPLRWRRLNLLSADIRIAQFCDEVEAQKWFARLRAEIPWERHHLRLFGREMQAPRLSCWVGDTDAFYRYSGARFVPHAWTPALSELREYLFSHCAESYNSALCNLYRNGADSMGWHSDNEAELGSEPVIASFSFGDARRFRLRHRHDPSLRLELNLHSGSLLRMAGATQRCYRHDLPKTAKSVDARINLTFRSIRMRGR